MGDGLKLDVSDGDIDIVVRPGGGVSTGGNENITVTGTAENDNVVRVLTTGAVDMSDGAVTNSGGDTNWFQLFGTTGSTFSFSGGGAYYGSIYAPHDEVLAETDFDASSRSTSTGGTGRVPRGLSPRYFTEPSSSADSTPAER